MPYLAGKCDHRSGQLSDQCSAGEDEERLPSSGGAAGPRASSAGLSCHPGIALLSSCSGSKSDNPLKTQNPELVSPVELKFFIF